MPVFLALCFQSFYIHQTLICEPERARTTIPRLRRNVIQNPDVKKSDRKQISLHISSPQTISKHLQDEKVKQGGENSLL